MSETVCPFCSPDLARVFLETELVMGLWDAFPVSSGHVLVVTRRHMASWFDASRRNGSALTAAIDSARRTILQRHRQTDSTSA